MATSASAPSSTTPWLLYAYPWMPYPRRLTIYLREKNIPSSQVTIVHVSDPPANEVVDPSFPPRPQGSLPILAIPNTTSPVNGTPSYTYIRQSIAIMQYLDEQCDAASPGFPKSLYPMRGADPLARARVTALMCLADQLTGDWNPIRTFASDAGTMSIPAAANEMTRWVKRTLATIEKWFGEGEEDFSALRKGGTRGPTMGEIVLYQFLEFTKDCYGKDMTRGSGQDTTDVYGRKETDSFPKLVEFYEAFASRDSARRDATKGEVASPGTLKRMQTWVDGFEY